MKIELIYDPSKVPPPSLASRVAPANKGNASGARMEGVQRFVGWCLLVLAVRIGGSWGLFV